MDNYSCKILNDQRSQELFSTSGNKTNRRMVSRGIQSLDIFYVAAQVCTQIPVKLLLHYHFRPLEKQSECANLLQFYIKRNHQQSSALSFSLVIKNFFIAIHIQLQCLLLEILNFEEISEIHREEICLLLTPLLFMALPIVPILPY